MYEARQRKEKVSRRIDEGSGTSQKVKFLNHVKQNKLIQKMQNFQFDNNDYSLDSADGHTDGIGAEIRYPKKGDLYGETERLFEASMPNSLQNYYYSNRSSVFQGNFDNIIQKVPKTITLRSTGIPSNYDYNRGPNFNINFSNNLIPNQQDPVDHGSLVDLRTGCNVPKHGIMLSGKMVRIAPGGKRYQHFSIADRLYPNNRLGTWTWHHLDNQYQMVLVDSAVHCPEYGGFWHFGGMSFWT